MPYKKRTQLLILLLVFSLKLKGQHMFDDYLWKNRLILIFTNDESNIHYQKQLKDFKSFPLQLKERDLLLFRFVGKTGISLESDVISTEKVEKARDLFDIDEKVPFTFLLMGKDGGVKIRSRKPVSPRSVFDKIDSMPMRQAGMQRKKKRNH